jgi:hypothetical protein
MMMTTDQAAPLAIPGFDLFGGKHCETASLMKLFRYHGLSYSEELLFGLGGGIGFVYWHPKGARVPFVGGRNGKFPGFVQRIGEQTGHPVRVITTRSRKRAEANLRAGLVAGSPVVCYGDIYYLPYFNVTRHFGGHAFVVYAIDDRERVAYLSDRGTSARMIRLDELARARDSPIPPFPPRNAQLDLEIRHREPIRPAAIRGAIATCRDAMVNPPIANLGLAGIRKFSGVLRTWVDQLDASELVVSLAETYVNLELAGTGGCAFRRMYHAFLVEAQAILGVDLGVPIRRLERAIGSWDRFINNLLPDASPGLRQMKAELRTKEGLFQDGTMGDMVRGGDSLRRLAQLGPEAADEVRRAPGLLAGLPSGLMEAAEAEAEFFEALDEALDPG